MHQVLHVWLRLEVLLALRQRLDNVGKVLLVKPVFFRLHYL